MNELICRTETNSQTLPTKLWFLKQAGRGEGWTGRGGLGCHRGVGGREGGTGGGGLAYAHCGTWHDWPTGTCSIAEGTLPNIL